MFNQTDKFDVLVVYSSEIATSASSNQANSNFPFDDNSSRAQYNEAYAYFLQICAKANLKAAFTTSKDIIGAGLCKSYWLYEKNRWIKIDNHGYAQLIFDKFSPSSKALKQSRRILFSNPKITPFNDPELFDLFFDKLRSYKQFSDFSIPTVAIVKNDIASIEKALKQLQSLTYQHKQNKDFGSSIILKDRHGSGGFDIYKIEADFVQNIYKHISSKRNIAFIIQPFVLFDQGYQYQQFQGAIDIRFIFKGGKIMQTYIRMAGGEDFRCNIHQGGSLHYLKQGQMRSRVVQYAQNIARELDKPNSVYALDFIVSNHGNIYFLEGNCGPGICWDCNLPKDEQMAKRLIHTIVKELKVRSEIINGYPQTPHSYYPLFREDDTVN